MPMQEVIELRRHKNSRIRTQLYWNKIRAGSYIKDARSKHECKLRSTKMEINVSSIRTKLRGRVLRERMKTWTEEMDSMRWLAGGDRKRWDWATKRQSNLMFDFSRHSKRKLKTRIREIFIVTMRRKKTWGYSTLRTL